MLRPARVGEEMRLTSPILAEEMHLVNLELRAGSSRERATGATWH